MPKRKGTALDSISRRDKLKQGFPVREKGKTTVLKTKRVAGKDWPVDRPISKKKKGRKTTFEDRMQQDIGVRRELSKKRKVRN